MTFGTSTYQSFPQEQQPASIFDLLSVVYAVCVIMLSVFLLGVFNAECRTFLILFLVSLCIELCIFIVILCFIKLSVLGAHYLMGENLKLVWAEFSTLS